MIHQNAHSTSCEGWSSNGSQMGRRGGDGKQKTAPRAQTIATRMSSASQRNAQPLPSVAKEYIIKHAQRNRRGQAHCMCCSPCYTAHTRRRQDVSHACSRCDTGRIARDRQCRRCRNALRTANTSCQREDEVSVAKVAASGTSSIAGAAV
jgi:hypothetical protein